MSSKRNSILLATGIVVGGLLVAAAVTLVEGRASPNDVSFGERESGGQPERPLSGVAPTTRESREVDPSNAARPWIAEGVDLNAVEAAPLVSRDEGPFELVEPTLGWHMGLATDDEFGEKSLACRIRFERKLGGEKCSMEQRIGVVDGEVAYIEPVIAENATNACRAFSRCMQEAWRGRSAPALGDGRDDYRMVTATTPVNTPETVNEDMPDEAYLDYYENLLEETETTHSAREQYVADAKASGEWDTWSESRKNSFPGNLAVSASYIADAKLMIELLRRRLEEQ